MLKERKLTVRTAAEGPVKVIMKELNTSLRGLDPETVEYSAVAEPPNLMK